MLWWKFHDLAKSGNFTTIQEVTTRYVSKTGNFTMLPEMENLLMLKSLETSTTFSISFAVNSETPSGVGHKISQWPVRPFSPS